MTAASSAIGGRSGGGPRPRARDGTARGVVVSPRAQAPAVRSLELPGWRIWVSTLVEADYPAWYEVRNRCRTGWCPGSPAPTAPPWPRRMPPASPPGASCASASGSWAGFGFGIFLEGRFVRGGHPLVHPAGAVPERVDRLLGRQGRGRQGLVPEAVVVVLQFAFESLHLHRIEVAIIPRNASSRRVAEKLGLRAEGVALGFLEINGEWEDHVRYAITAEEWATRRGELLGTWLRRV